MIKVAPSLLAADYRCLGDEVRRMAEAGADYLHFDVMDGTFVPNLSFGADMARQLKDCGLPIDAHLMTVSPHLHRTLQMIRAAGCLAGVALNPATSPECLRYVMGDFDLALVMTVNPGYGGQKLIPACIEKAAEVRAMLDKAGVEAIVEVDGGVNLQTAPKLVAAGADMLVAGSALYGAADARAFIEQVKETAR